MAPDKREQGIEADWGCEVKSASEWVHEMTTKERGLPFESAMLSWSTDLESKAFYPSRKIHGRIQKMIEEYIALAQKDALENPPISH